MKTKEELISLKEEVEALNRKLSELSDEELSEVIGGINGSALPNADVSSRSEFSKDFEVPESDRQYDIHIYPKTKPDDFTPNFNK